MKKILAIDDQPEVINIIADFLNGKKKIPLEKSRR
jgi:hypothetical protein